VGLMRFNITVEVDVTAMMDSARIIMGNTPIDTGTIELRVGEAIKRSIKDGVPHVVNVRDFDMKDC
jgi:hypothetical protein